MINISVVAILDSNFNQILADARPIKATVKETAKTMTHPVEDGSVITDHRIIEPIEISLSLLISVDNYKDVYEQLKSNFINSNILKIMTKTGLYENLIISAMPHDETPEMLGALAIAVSFKEVKIVTPETVQLAPKSPKHSGTKNNGKQQSTNETPPAKKKSVLAGLFG